MSDIAVIGAGKWGEALHFALSQKNSVKIWSRTKREIKGFCSLQEALECKYLVVAIGTQSLGEWLEESFRFSGQKILVASKGIESPSGRFLNDIYTKFVPPQNMAYLSGPSFAAEVSKALPTALVISGTNAKLCEEYADFFASFIKVYTSDDVIGAEVAGAYKNVIAIASGICEGLNLGNNARAALITRGLAEMSRFGAHFGAKLQTFLGLSGVGDLFLTATSVQSRNFRVGLGLSEGKNIQQILSELGETAEGVQTAYGIVKIAEEKGLYTPIAKEVCAILNGQSAHKSIAKLLESGKREEF